MTCDQKLAKLILDSVHKWNHSSNWDEKSHKYIRSMRACITETCSNEPSFIQAIYLLLEYSWNDAIEWAQGIISGSNKLPLSRGVYFCRFRLRHVLRIMRSSCHAHFTSAALIPAHLLLTDKSSIRTTNLL
jgi:hypothetical protein